MPDVTKNVDLLSIGKSEILKNNESKQMQNRNSMNILTREYLTGAPIPLDLQLI